jgi:hypothetical protein
MARADKPEKKSTDESLSSGITRQPTEEEFQLGDREKRLLDGLFEWQDRSQKTHWILGQPLGGRSF